MTDESGTWRGAIGLGVLVGGLVWSVGLNAPQSLLLGAAVAAIRAGVSALHLGLDPVWPSPVDPRGDGLRTDVSRLSWTLSGRDGTVGPVAVARFRALAERRLAEHHLTLDDTAEAAALLGSAAYSVAIADPTDPVRHRALAAGLLALEALDRNGNRA